MADVIINNMQKKITVTKGFEDLIVKAVNTTLLVEKISRSIEVSIALVDDDYIRKLNKNYRSMDVPTDVLSFVMRETIEDLELLGDIVISLERAKEQAAEYNHSFKREIGYLVVHGMLHLLGYDHETEQGKAIMRQKEEEVLRTIDLARGFN